MLVALLVPWLASSCMMDGDDGQEGGTAFLERGTPAPDFMVFPDGGQEGFALSSLRGNPVVLEFWASWCPDCQAATAGMVGLFEEFSPLGIVFVGYSLDTDEGQWREYREENGMDWIHCLSPVEWDESEVAQAYNVRWIPTLYLIDADGMVDFATSETDEMAERLREITGE